MSESTVKKSHQASLQNHKIQSIENKLQMNVFQCKTVVKVANPLFLKFLCKMGYTKESRDRE